MQIIRVVPCALLVAVACGGGGKNNDVPIDAPKVDASPDIDAPPSVDASEVDGPVDGPPATGPVNLTNLTAIAGVSLRSDFTTPLFFSPDGTKVAVVASYSQTANPVRMEPHVVNLDGSGVRRLFAVPAACGACDTELLAWTADSTALFVTGDLTTNNETEAYRLNPAMTDQALVVAADALTGGDAVNLFTVDAGGGATRVWVVGDWLTDNRREAGAFAGDAVLPFNTATPPPILAPGGNTAELFDVTNSTANVFDARGGKIAFVADSAVAGRFDLNVANADGSTPVLLIQGQAGVEISSVALSPDGTKVAFTMDSVAINNGFDLHVVATAGGTPVKVSPDRPVASAAPDQQDVFFQPEWSSDSKFLAFSADLTENNFDQGYVVDTTVAVPVAVEVLKRSDIAIQAMGAQGIRGKLLFDNANNLYFRARVSTANSSQFTLFKAAPDGSKVELALPMRTDATVPDIGAFGITRDGTKLIFSSDSPTILTFNLFSQAL